MSRNGDKQAREFGPKFLINHQPPSAQKQSAGCHPRVRQRERRPVDPHYLTACHLFGKQFSALFVIENSVLDTARVGKPVFGQAFLLAVSGILKTRPNESHAA